MQRRRCRLWRGCTPRELAGWSYVIVPPTTRVVTELDVEAFDKAVKGTKPHAAPGRNGIRFEHLETELRLGDVQAMDDAMARVVAGSLPPLATELEYIGALTALLEPNGSVRPIGNGSA